MNDTSPLIEEKVREMIRKKSPNERLRMGCSMRATSKQLIICSILNRNPTISDVELKQEFFLIFYGNDYSETERKKYWSISKIVSLPILFI